MQLPSGPALITPDRIPVLLATVTAGTLPPDYQRLLEIYCVVKAGGVAVQRQVAQRLEETERAAIAVEIQALRAQPHQPDRDSRIRALEQEILELQQSIRDRCAYLGTIQPTEEAAVRQCLATIDSHFLLRHQGETDPGSLGVVTADHPLPEMGGNQPSHL